MLAFRLLIALLKTFFSSKKKLLVCIDALAFHNNSSAYLFDFLFCLSIQFHLMNDTLHI